MTLSAWQLDADDQLAGIQYVTRDFGQEKTTVEVRDADSSIVDPYARLTWGYTGSGDSDGFLDLEIAGAGGSLASVLHADIEGTTLYALGSPGARVDLRAKAGIRLYATGADHNWGVSETGVLQPGGPKGGFDLPVKDGPLAEEDFGYWTEGRTGINRADPRIEVYVGGVLYYVSLTPA